MEFNKKTMRKIMQLITFTVLLLVGLMNIDVVMDTIGWIFEILMPFIIGGCIAFIIGVPMKLFEEKIFRKGKSNNKILEKIRRPLSILLSLLTIIGLVLIVILLIAPELTSTVTKLVNETIPDFINNVEKWVVGLTEKYPAITKYVNEYEFDWDKISGNILNITQDLANGVFSSTLSFLGAIVSTITNFAIGLVFSIYLLSNKEKIAMQGKKILYGYLPVKRADRVISILKLTHTSFSNFLSGQCVEAVIEGCLFFIALSIFGFNYALLIGVIAAFTALIPIFGAFIAFGIGFLLLFMVNPIQALWFIVIFLVIQQVESNLIYPYVVGGSIGLPSIWVLFAVTVGGSLMGVAGMLIFIPLFSVFYILLRETVRVRLIVKRIPSEKYENEFAIDFAEQRRELEQIGHNRERRHQEEQMENHGEQSKGKQSKKNNSTKSSGQRSEKPREEQTTSLPNDRQSGKMNGQPNTGRPNGKQNREQTESRSKEKFNGKPNGEQTESRSNERSNREQTESRSNERPNREQTESRYKEKFNGKPNGKQSENRSNERLNQELKIENQSTNQKKTNHERNVEERANKSVGNSSQVRMNTLERLPKDHEHE